MSRLIKTKRDHRRLRGVIAENVVDLTFNPAAGALTAGVVGTPYNRQLAVSNGVGAAKFSLASGSLPAGLTMNAAGLISGTPTAAVSNRAFSVRATDEFGNTKTAAYTLTVTA